jgi:hypothetical protein
MTALAPTSPAPETTLKRTGELFKKDKGELALESITATKSVYLDQQFACPGIVFEPLKNRKHSFLYSTYLWSEGDESEVVVMFTTHRVIIKGNRLDRLPEDFSGQKVRRVCVLGRADSMLAENGDVKAPLVKEIIIDRVTDEG